LSKWKTGYLLYPTTSLPDIVPEQNAEAIWRNHLFAMYRLEGLQNLLVLGSGWYRQETMAPGDLGPRPFRWLRKRAEIFFFNPSPGPHRLILNALSGFGNPSPVRHLQLFCNGEKFDEVTINGYSRFLTKSFTAMGKANDIEIRVEEDAHPLPRSHPLWKSWVPSDPRRLNIAVFEVRVVDDSFVYKTSSVDFHSPTQFNSTFFDGIYPDRWTGPSSSFNLSVSRNSRALLLRGVAPDSPRLRYPLPLKIYAGSFPLHFLSMKAPGPFDLSLPLPEALRGNSPSRTIDFYVQTNSDCFSGPKDSRCLSIRLDGAQVSGTNNESHGVLARSIPGTY
jgi:hypothetical protein